MKKYLVRFVTIDGDYDKEWCYAENSEEAESSILSDRWDVDYIEYVEEL
jgi:hypothetical protein